SKYSLVILEAKRAHELEAGAKPTQEFTSVKSTLRALEEIESGNVVIHPDPEANVRLFVAVPKRLNVWRKKKSVKSKLKLLKKKKKAKRFRYKTRLGLPSGFLFTFGMMKVLTERRQVI
ncbi:DNA-directed RNA polymerase subunit omega, partial [Xanthomonas citri pv. citri]